jgi:hypothetical protein
MIMKTIRYILLIIVLSSGVLSCKDILELNPNDSLSSETFWKTDKDVKLALAGVYAYMVNSTTFSHGRKLWDGLSDVAYTGGFSSITLGNLDANTGSISSSVFNQCYAMISRCNIFLANVDAVVMDEKLKAQYKGEVQFMRAISYFTLTEFYGGVPIYTTPPTIEESKIAQSSKADVVKLILADLDAAIASLPDDAYSGHAVKGSALALKSQVLMHNQRWAEAATTAKIVMTSGKFSIYKGGYQNLFIKPGQNNNPEILFSVRYLKPNNICPQTTDGNPDLMSAWDLAVTPLRYFVDAFQCKDGKPIGESSLYSSADIFKDRDPRLVLMAVTKNHKFADGTVCDISGRLQGGTGFYSDKYVDWNNYGSAWSWAVRSDQDFVLLRYAQVLLMYAECTNEATGPDQSVYDAINAIRTRPSVDMPPLPAGLSQSQMRQRIRDERLYELSFEGLRYWDLLRWKTAETVIPTLTNPGNYPRKFNPAKNYLFPFPQSELDRNKKLTQNPNY